jgi:KaiC/GvpD/RAD55 family RecA-like ATPase
MTEEERAELIRQAREQGWDEGYWAHQLAQDNNYPTQNPYRA